MKRICGRKRIFFIKKDKKFHKNYSDDGDDDDDDDSDNGEFPQALSVGGSVEIIQTCPASAAQPGLPLGGHAKSHRPHISVLAFHFSNEKPNKPHM